MNLRIKKIVSGFERNKIDALLVTKDVNISYLTYFSASESWLLILPQKSFYITDFRYLLEAKQGLKGITVKRYSKSIYETVLEIAKVMKLRKIGFDDRHLTVSQYKALSRACLRQVKLIAINNLVENLREVKEPAEIQEIKKALKVHAQTLKFLKGIIKPGISEFEVCRKLENYVKSKGYGFSFPSIIASGPNSAFPHARPTSRRIRNNESVLVDIGIEVNGYKSDLTRIFFLGRIPPLVKKVSDCVKQAQQKAIAKIKAGVAVADVDREARKYLAKHKLDQYFGHSLGHGVGLEIHETPRLSEHSSAILKEGMIVTVEPGVYLPNQFGIRHEEMILVQKQEVQVLSGYID